MLVRRASQLRPHDRLTSTDRYADTIDGDWLIDWHPAKKNLMMATAGCGHAFKVRS